MDCDTAHGHDITRHDIARHGAADPLAMRARRPMSYAAFQRDAAALAARLPAHDHILNICTDRYKFMVGLAAALCRRRISLLPPSHAAGVLDAVQAAYPGVPVLDDSAVLAAGDAPAPRLPAIPPAQTAVILFTSGSTGQPKPVAKDWGTLVRSARAAGARLGIAKLRGATIIGTVPHQHSYGLESMVMLGLQHGLVIDSGWPLYPADIRAALARAPRPRILVTTPVHLRALLAEPDDLPPVDLILSATAPLPQALAAQAEQKFAAPLIEIYGCTEAGQMATRRTAQDIAWQCLDGVALTQDAQGTWASGPAVAGATLLQDIIEPAGPGLFALGDRAADLVDVAGKRTSLAHLNFLLLAIPGVQDGAFILAEPDGKRVPRLMALVVAPGLTPQTIMQALRARIDPAFLPRPLVFVDALPRNALGKLPREALLRLAGRGA
jgi:acyl-coenzyme A synthetase/AMP-(fatty) acid ligase